MAKVDLKSSWRIVQDLEIGVSVSLQNEQLWGPCMRMRMKWKDLPRSIAEVGLGAHL